MHEAQLWKHNCFVTLTYSDENLPTGSNLNYRDFQLFMKRLRKAHPGREIRFYMCGEYGSGTRRPHYHAALFNMEFPDKVLYKTVNKNKLFNSPLLSKLWPLGHANIGELTYQSAAYIARYITDKITIDSHNPISKKTKKNYSYHYDSIDPVTGEITQLTPEFQQSSRDPGLGFYWFKKFKKDVFPINTVKSGSGANQRSVALATEQPAGGRNASIIYKGKSFPAPRYYKDKYRKENPLNSRNISALNAEALLRAIPENSNQRINAKRLVKEAQLKQLKRKLS